MKEEKQSLIENGDINKLSVTDTQSSNNPNLKNDNSSLIQLGKKKHKKVITILGLFTLICVVVGALLIAGVFKKNSNNNGGGKIHHVNVHNKALYTQPQPNIPKSDSLSDPNGFSPYVDVTMLQNVNAKLSDYFQYGTKSITAAFLQQDALNLQTPDLKWASTIAYDGSDAATSSQAAYINETVRNFQSSGGKIILSLGGANGICMWNIKNNTASDFFQKVESNLLAVGKFYHCYNFDFDIEGENALNKIGTTALGKACAFLKQQQPSAIFSITLAVLPTGLTDGKNTLDWFLGGYLTEYQQENKNKVINYFPAKVNIMTMDYGTGSAENGWNDQLMGKCCVDAVTSTAKQVSVSIQKYKSKMDKTLDALTQAGIIQQIIIATPMIGCNDVQGEIFTIAKNKNNTKNNENSDLVTFCKFIQLSHLNGLRFWSLNRDINNGNSLPNSSNVKQVKGQFEQYFNLGLFLSASNKPKGAVKLAVFGESQDLLQLTINFSAGYQNIFQLEIFEKDRFFKNKFVTAIAVPPVAKNTSLLITAIEDDNKKMIGNTNDRNFYAYAENLNIADTLALMSNQLPVNKQVKSNLLPKIVERFDYTKTYKNPKYSLPLITSAVPDVVALVTYQQKIYGIKYWWKPKDKNDTPDKNSDVCFVWPPGNLKTPQGVLSKSFYSANAIKYLLA